MTPPAVVAAARGSLTRAGWNGVVQVVELIDGQIDSTDIAVCSHRHRLSRTARTCAERMGNRRDVHRRAAAEIRRREQR